MEGDFSVKEVSLMNDIHSPNVTDLIMSLTSLYEKIQKNSKKQDEAMGERRLMTWAA